MKTSTISIIGLVVLGFVALNGLFIVQQTQQGIVLQFGEPKRTLQDPGLNWKIPLFRMLFSMKTAFCRWCHLIVMK